jgi:hypothetical protein
MSKMYRSKQTGMLFPSDGDLTRFDDQWEEVRETDTFADLITYGEWMPVEKGEK